MIKNNAKTDFKVFLSCLVLLDFLTLFHKFCPRLRFTKRWRSFFVKIFLFSYVSVVQDVTFYPGAKFKAIFFHRFCSKCLQHFCWISFLIVRIIMRNFNDSVVFKCHMFSLDFIILASLVCKKPKTFQETVTLFPYVIEKYWFNIFRAAVSFLYSRKTYEGIFKDHCKEIWKNLKITEVFWCFQGA